MPYIRRGEKATPWVPWADWFNSDQDGGQRRHQTRLKADRKSVKRALAMEPGRRVVCTWKRIGQTERLEIRGVLVRVYPYILPGIVVCVVKLSTKKTMRVEASRVRYEVNTP